jgi:hypothetical protein
MSKRTITYTVPHNPAYDWYSQKCVELGYVVAPVVSYQMWQVLDAQRAELDAQLKALITAKPFPSLGIALEVSDDELNAAKQLYRLLDNVAVQLGYPRD